MIFLFSLTLVVFLLKVWDEMLNGDIFKYGNYFHNVTGSNDYDNFLNTNAPDSFGYYAAYVNQVDIAFSFDSFNW